MIHIRNSTHIQSHDDDNGSDLDNGKRRGHYYDPEEEEVSDLDGGQMHKRKDLKLKWESEEGEAESDLDQGFSGRVIPGKRMGKMGIMRRKCVSKSKGSPYRSSGSSHDEDLSPLVGVASGSGQGDQRRNGE